MQARRSSAALQPPPEPLFRVLTPRETARRRAQLRKLGVTLDDGDFHVYDAALVAPTEEDEAHA